jgi:putative transposase
MDRSSFRCQSRRPDEGELRKRRTLAAQRPPFGARRLWLLLRREGRIVNHKKVERLCPRTRAIPETKKLN